MTELEKQFSNVILSNCSEMKKLGYAPTRFSRMISEHGALGAAKRIIINSNVTERFEDLYMINRLDLSVEAIVLQPEFKPLFSREERQVCREHLRSVNYEVPEEEDNNIENIPVEDKEFENVPVEELEISILEKEAKKRESAVPKTREVVVPEKVRDPYIAEYAKRRAKGICQLCGQQAPFYDKNGRPFLESHHIIWLKDGGADSIDNTVALCPNCHRKMHHLNNPEDVETLKNKVAENK